MSENILKKPHWIRAKAPVSKGYQESKQLINELKLNTFEKI